MRGVLARWLLLVTAAALVLLGRPTEQLCAQQSDDAQVSLGSADDVSLRSERRHTPTIRLAHTDAETDDDAWSHDLADLPENAVPVAPLQVLALCSATRRPPCIARSSSVSARGPPSIRA